jgi:uncharacterized protein (DUF924 family)
METSKTINDFWFGSLEDDKAIADQRARLWWSKDPVVDADIRSRFENCIAKATQGRLDDWTTSPAGCLALILLTDQCPRNVYRDTAAAFASDPKARSLCKDGLAKGLDHALRPIERVFFYLPLEHSESIVDQDHAVALFEQLAATAKPEHRPVFDDYFDYALRHREVIRRFGRFPHRNRILGRESSREELTFLAQKGSSF